MSPFARGALIFLGVLLVLPWMTIVLILMLGGLIGSQRAPQLAFILIIEWLHRVLPHGNLRFGRQRMFPGASAQIAALIQWAVTMVVVAWVTRKQSAVAQLWISVVAILVVGTAFLWFAQWLGYELPHMDL